MNFHNLCFSPENNELPYNYRSYLAQYQIPHDKYLVNDQKMIVDNSMKIQSYNNIAEINGVKVQVKRGCSDSKIVKINEQQGPSKISSSNSYKKLICIARQTLLGVLTPEDEYRFLRDFQSFKNTKSYFFIILAHAKILLPTTSIQAFTKSFVRKINNKIYYYQREINKTKNIHIRKLRLREISDIESALKSYHLYFEGNIDDAISTFYKKEKAFFKTTKQYYQTLQTIINVETILTRQTLRYSFLSSPNFCLYDKMIMPDMPKSDLKSSELTYPFLNSKDKLAGFDPDNIAIQAKWPLLGLQNTYPIYEHFFPTIFNYGGQYIEKVGQSIWNIQPKQHLLYDKYDILQVNNHKDEEKL